MHLFSYLRGEVIFMEIRIAPSMLSADFSRLKEETEMVNRSEADWFHLDVMDGTFVPNISFGFPVISAIRKFAKKPLDVHLMIVNPEYFLSQFKEAGAEVLTVHYEACTHLHRTLSEIRKLGMKAGLALNPHTPVSQVADVLECTDLVCLMGVNPGFGGQKLIEGVYKKAAQLREMIANQGREILIEIDGGVDLSNYKNLIRSGADVLVAGNAVFADKNPELVIKNLKSSI